MDRAYPASHPPDDPRGVDFLCGQFSVRGEQLKTDQFGYLQKPGDDTVLSHDFFLKWLKKARTLREIQKAEQQSFS